MGVNAKANYSELAAYIREKTIFYRFVHLTAWQI